MRDSDDFRTTVYGVRIDFHGLSVDEIPDTYAGSVFMMVHLVTSEKARKPAVSVPESIVDCGPTSKATV